MKKNFLIGAIILGAASFSMLTGFDSALTAEDVLAKSQEAGFNMEQVSADAGINFDVNIAVPAADMTLGIKADGKETMGMTMNPLGLAADMDMAVSAMGQNLNMKANIYGVMEEGDQFAMYTKVTMEGEEAPQWTKTTTDASQITAAMDQMKEMKFDFSSLPFTFKLDPEPMNVNGKECYVLSTSATFNEIYLLAEPFLGQLPEGVTKEELDSYSQLLSGLVFNLQMCVDTETFRPMSAHFDLEGSDLTTIAAMVSSLFGADENGNAYEVNLSVNAAAIDITYDYETPVEIVLPADAASAQAVDPSSLLDMVESADDAA